MNTTAMHSAELDRLLQHADRIADAGGANLIGVEHLLLAMLLDPAAIPTRELSDIGLDSRIVFMRLAEHTQGEAGPSTPNC